jgi:hypothetical protein
VKRILIKVMVFWVLVPCSLVGGTCFGYCTTSVFRDEVCNQGYVFIALLSTLREE